MGCFVGCLGSSKDQKHRKHKYKVIPRHQKHKSQNLVKAELSLQQRITERPTNSDSESSRKTKEPLKLGPRKKVTFDTNVTTYDYIQVYDSTESLLEKHEKGETFSKSDQPQFDSEDDLVVLSIGSYPQNNRYRNCHESDDEVEDSDYEKEDDDDDYDDDEIMCQEVWSKSTLVSSTKSRIESSSLDAVGSNMNGGDKSAYVLSVFNPIENLEQWKALKSKRSTPLNFDRQKENFSLNFTSHKLKNRNQETKVDGSLSNWLISSTTLVTDQMLKIGCVGSHWSQTGEVIASKSTSTFKCTPNTIQLSQRGIFTN